MNNNVVNIIIRLSYLYFFQVGVTMLTIVVQCVHIFGSGRCSVLSSVSETSSIPPTCVYFLCVG